MRYTVHCVKDSLPADGGGEEVLPARGPVWNGSVQPRHRLPTVPTGSLQEAAESQSLPGRHEGV